MNSPKAAQEELPLWKGRRGLVNTGIVAVLALACAFGLWILAERMTIVPACSVYAQANGMTYSDFRLVGLKRQSNVVCQLKRADGGKVEMYLEKIASIPADYWASFAMSIEFTIPGFAILLAMGRVWIYRRFG